MGSLYKYFVVFLFQDYGEETPALDMIKEYVKTLGAA